MSRKSQPAIDRILSRIRVTDSCCWEWTGATFVNGYGRIKDDSRRLRRVHRLAYEHFRGPIPEGLQLDHQCHNADESSAGGITCPHRRCANPWHLEPVTAKENVARGRVVGAGVRQAAKTHCPQGHPYDEANTNRNPQTGYRHCRTCDRDRKRRAAEVSR